MKKINLFVGALIGRKAGYMEWSDYRNKVKVIDEFRWQQRVRKKSIANLST